jgi:selenocysteine-specific elongation factor
MLVVEARAFSRARGEALREELLDVVGRFHDAHPLRGGMPRAALEGQRGAPVGPLARWAVDAALDKGELVPADASGALALPGRATLDPDALPPDPAEVLARVQAGATTPPTMATIASSLGWPLRRVHEAATSLQRAGLLVRVSDERSWTPSALDRIVHEAREVLRNGGQLDVGALRERLGMSRQWAIAVLEWMDHTGVTVRRDDTRRPGPRF